MDGIIEEELFYDSDFEIIADEEMEQEINRREPTIDETILSMVEVTQQHLDEEKESCSICLEEYTVGEACLMCPQCQGIQHTHCMLRSLKSHNTCPLCRLHVIKNNVNLNMRNDFVPILLAPLFHTSSSANYHQFTIIALYFLLVASAWMCLVIYQIFIE